MVLQFSDWYVKQWQIPQARTSRLKYQWIYLLFRRYGTKYSSVLGLKGFHSISFFALRLYFHQKEKKTSQLGVSYTTTKYCQGKFFWWILFGFLTSSLCISLYALHTQHLSKNIYFTSWMFSSLLLKLRKELVSPVLGELKLMSRF